MKTRNIFILSLICMTTIAFSALTEISKKERDLASSYLRETQQKLIRTVKPLSEEQLKFKASPESWSIAECVEHLALSEELIFSWSQDALSNSAEKGEIAFQDEVLINILTDRTQKSKTTSTLEPKGSFKSAEEALRNFNERRKQHIQYVKTTTDPLRTSYFDFPFGKGDAYQVILLLAAHTERHTDQILEIISSDGFPKSN